jgi:hypothetical protein
MAIWHRRRNQRAAGLAAVWFVAVCIWLWALVGENWLLRPGSERRMLEDLPGMIETTQARLVTFGYTSDSLSFYHKQEVPRIKNAKDLAKNLKRFRHQLTVVADAQDWKVFAPKHAAITDQFTKVTELQSRAMLGKTRWVLRAQDVGPNETENRKVVPAPDSSTDLLRWP